MYSYNNSSKAKVNIPVTTNWQELAIFIIQNKQNLSYSDLSQANRRLEGAIDMQISFGNGMSNVGISGQIGTFLRTY
jgi:hypothetical protein